VEVKVPTRLSREQRKLLEQLRDTLPVDNAPSEKGLFEKVKDYFMCGEPANFASHWGFGAKARWQSSALAGRF